jgi:hypothetical protein
MAEADIPGPDHRAPDAVEMDEATGTPPFIPAAWRTGIYIGTLIVDVIAFAVLGILGVLGVIDRGVASEIGIYILGAINMISVGLSVGYRPTRPGSPIAP